MTECLCRKCVRERSPIHPEIDYDAYNDKLIECRWDKGNPDNKVTYHYPKEDIGWRDCCRDLWDMLLIMLHLKKNPYKEGDHE